MSFEARCPQCVFVSRHIGQSTPCLLHVSLAPVAELADADEAEAPPEESRDYDEPYVFGQARPTVDRPWPFTLRQYVRLMLLRGRIQATRDSSGEDGVSMLERGKCL